MLIWSPFREEDRSLFWVLGNPLIMRNKGKTATCFKKLTQAYLQKNV